MLKGLRKHQHNIGHWAMELLVVFVGVLIALSAQTWAQDRSAKSRAEAAEVRIRYELGGGVSHGIERIALATCLNERLTNLAAALSRGQTEWSGLKIADVATDRMAFARLYRTPSREWVSSEYRGSVAIGALDPLAPERTAALAASYSQIQKSSEINAEEERLATRLGALQFDTALTGPERNELLATLTRLDYLNGLMVVVATQNAERFRNLYRFTPDEINQVRNGWVSEVERMRSIYGGCVDSQAIGIVDQRLLTKAG